MLAKKILYVCLIFTFALNTGCYSMRVVGSVETRNAFHTLKRGDRVKITYYNKHNNIDTRKGLIKEVTADWVIFDGKPERKILIASISRIDFLDADLNIVTSIAAGTGAFLVVWYILQILSGAAIHIDR
jgi:hypothetical protein